MVEYFRNTSSSTTVRAIGLITNDNLYCSNWFHFILGVISHYFFLAFCFWSLCYVINAYSVIIKRAHKVFDKKRKYHLIQFSICSTLPALFVVLNMTAKKPGYKSLFLDRMTSVFTSPVLEYVTFTLPVQIAIGISVSLLWSIIRFVRKVSSRNVYSKDFWTVHIWTRLTRQPVDAVNYSYEFGNSSE
jgi:SNF family Na+-dependent transporter